MREWGEERSKSQPSQEHIESVPLSPIATAAGDPTAEHLHTVHEALVTALAKVKEEIGDVWEASAVGHFSAFLRTWLIDHVIKEDLLMKPFLKKFSPRFDLR